MVVLYLRPSLWDLVPARVPVALQLISNTKSRDVCYIGQVARDSERIRKKVAGFVILFFSSPPDATKAARIKHERCIELSKKCDWRSYIGRTIVVSCS